MSSLVSFWLHGEKSAKVIFDPLVPDFGIVEQWQLHGEVRVTSRNINIFGLSRLNIFPLSLICEYILVRDVGNLLLT